MCHDDLVVVERNCFKYDLNAFKTLFTSGLPVKTIFVQFSNVKLLHAHCQYVGHGALKVVKFCDKFKEQDMAIPYK